VVFLLDQSTSMEEVLAGSSMSKAVALANTVNSAIYNLFCKCYTAGGIRDYIDFAISGYSGMDQTNPEITTCVGPGASGSWVLPMSEIADLFVRTEKEDGLTKPIWVEPVANGWTPMCTAMEMVGGMIYEWATAHPTSFPPIVVNVTDGEATDGGLEDIITWAERIKGIRTQDGNALLFNIHLSTVNGMSNGGPVVFPDDPGQLPRDDAFAEALWHASSVMPTALIQNARKSNLPASQSARLFAFNASHSELVSILNFGTDLETPR
jgi:hypothetical protein